MRDISVISIPFPSMRNSRAIISPIHWEQHWSLLATKKGVLSVLLLGISLFLIIFSALQRGEHAVCDNIHDEMACFQRLIAPLAP